ncbi:MAG: multicopper oxidase domain-containing protein [Trueperaceae bacterium]|nr:multicopper oxidase domain-containing protein [Trueperaceae bacterium]
MNRRHFLKLSGLSGAALLAACNAPESQQPAEAPNEDPNAAKPVELESEWFSTLSPQDQPKFVSRLPLPERIYAMSPHSNRVFMNSEWAWHSFGLRNRWGMEKWTPTFRYHQAYTWSKQRYLGPTIIAKKDVPTYVNWDNWLPSWHLLAVDDSIHQARPQYGYKYGIPMVTHLHGGLTEPSSDGYPEAWHTRKEQGEFYVSDTATYDNAQEAQALWYHDHAMGITRLNVYAGLAGMYLIRDDNEIELMRSHVLPSEEHEAELIIQDKSFNERGQIFMPSDPGIPGAPSPSIVPEFFGDYILVNGKIWPYHKVEARKYRFRVLNAADSRFFELKLSNGNPIMVIGTDNGFLEHPVEVTSLPIAPGERYDIVIDFSQLKGQTVIMQNIGPDGPAKGGTEIPADPATTGQVMAFKVGSWRSYIPNASVHTGSTLRSAIQPFSKIDHVRQVALFESMDKYGRMRPQLGTLTDGNLGWMEPITEFPRLGSTEIWEIYNTTEDVHPVHLHACAFQILDRASFSGELMDMGMDMMGGSKQKLVNAERLTTTARPAEAFERGWKDEVRVFPGEVARIAVNFTIAGRFVWHCHILSHEDYDMMRPFEVIH